MEKPKMLSGDHLVAKNITKIEATLPEIGLKDVLPNGSWLEQKQIQAALEARKHLIEVERIEKCGTLSHAKWREDLMLAEVTRKVGSYWQYMGHNVGKHLFLQPEEALFLMEVNSLLLKHNEITVSLQKAYSLLLGKTISIDQYKVYASLSRLGYRVLRHKEVDASKDLNKITSKIPAKDGNDAITSDNTSVEMSEMHVQNTQDTTSTIVKTETPDNSTIVKDLNKDSDVTSSDDIEKSNASTSNNMVGAVNSGNMSQIVKSRIKTDRIIDVDDNMNEKQSCDNTNAHTDSDNNHVADSGVYSIEDVDDENENGEVITVMEEDVVNVDMANNGPAHENIIISKDITEPSTINYRKRKSPNDINECTAYYYQNKLQKLQNRKFKPGDRNNFNEFFNNIPNFCNSRIVTVKVPQEQHIPKNIFVNNTSYVLNLNKIQSKSSRPESTESTTYSLSDEVNDAHIRRLRSFPNELPQQSFMNARFPRHQHQFRPFNIWRPRHNFSYYHFSLFLQRPFHQQTYFPPRAQFQTFQPQTNPRQFMNPHHNNVNANNTGNESNTRKRNRDEVKSFHLQAVKNLAMRLKTLCQSGNVQTQNINSLKRLLDIYNVRYNERLILTENFDVVNNSQVIETIELDDSEESTSKKPRVDENPDNFNKNLNKFKALAAKLKELEAKDRSSGRLRRAFSNALKTFNKTYNADVYLNVNYEIIDRKHITLDCSSDSDCVIEETNNTHKGKKLRNPFNILKRLSEKLNPRSGEQSTSKVVTDNNTIAMETEAQGYSEHLLNTFDKKWLPDDKDFGRAELVPQNLMNLRLLDIDKEGYVYEYMKDQKHDCRNWLDMKISFLSHIQETHLALQRAMVQENSTKSETGLKPIIGPDDCTDMSSILEKLRIIQTNSDVVVETNLAVDFDVYNRDVQNFKKKNRPKAHFRVICKNETTSFPCAKDIAALQSKYDDDVPIVFAVVGVGSTSYLQINSSNLPVYIPSNDLS